jgi:MFS family permease
MNRPQTVINYVNIAHFIDHYAMLIFAAAVILMAPAFGLGYAEMLPYATPGFVAFGAGSLAAGWLGDRWSRRHMMALFFIGIGLSMISVGFVQTPLQLGLALFAVGIFASIYHPVGTAMIVSYAEQIGREVGINGVFGNLGVALSALITGVLAQYLGWRWAFIVPGAVTIAIGIAFMRAVSHEVRKGHTTEQPTSRVAKKDMWRVFLSV